MNGIQPTADVKLIANPPAPRRQTQTPDRGRAAALVSAQR
jgi:hypothetical protein